MPNIVAPRTPQRLEYRSHQNAGTRLSELGQAGGEFWDWERAKSESVLHALDGAAAGSRVYRSFGYPFRYLW